MELLILHVVIIYLVACTISIFLNVFVECTKEACKRILYKRAKVVPVPTAMETPLPTDWYAVDTLVHPVAELKR
jgi:hypothetical protein